MSIRVLRGREPANSRLPPTSGAVTSASPTRIASTPVVSGRDRSHGRHIRRVVDAAFSDDVHVGGRLRHRRSVVARLTAKVRSPRLLIPTRAGSQHSRLPAPRRCTPRPARPSPARVRARADRGAVQAAAPQRSAAPRRRRPARLIDLIRIASEVLAQERSHRLLAPDPCKSSRLPPKYLSSVSTLMHAAPFSQ